MNKARHIDWQIKHLKRFAYKYKHSIKQYIDYIKKEEKESSANYEAYTNFLIPPEKTMKKEDKKEEKKEEKKKNPIDEEIISWDLKKRLAAEKR